MSEGKGGPHAGMSSGLMRQGWGLGGGGACDL